MELRQFKLTSNEEIICEVVEWNDENTDNMLIRKALKLVSFDDTETSLRYYTFKPWLSMATNLEDLCVLNSYHILAESHPSQYAKEYYFEIINELKEVPDDASSKLVTFHLDSDSQELVQLH